MSASDSPHGYESPPGTYTPTNSYGWDDAFHNLLNPVEPNEPAFSYTHSAQNMSSWPAQPGRLSNGYVDLTSSHVDPTSQEDERRRRRHPYSPPAGPSSKRQKREERAAAEGSDSTPAKIEAIDLSQDDDILEVLEKQRQQTVKAQAKPEETLTTFNTLNCVICMDRPTDITATACGHLFCHTCLMEALIAGENRAAPGEPKRSQCPVCRKSISRTRAADIIPLLLKKGLATQPRRKADTSTTAPSPKATSRQPHTPRKRGAPHKMTIYKEEFV